MESKETKVTLITATKHPLEATYIAWMQSRSAEDLPTTGEVQRRRQVNPSFDAEVKKVFLDAMTMKMPLMEMLDVTFAIENMPVALREQIVRHRVGHKFDDRIGADIVPEVAGNSTFWSQTMRITDVSHFFDNGDYYTPEIAKQNPGVTHAMPCFGTEEDALLNAEEYYKATLLRIQKAYQNLIEKYGWPMEDARNVLPVALQHRMVWKTNIHSLLHVLSKRTCWHAQLGMWKPVIYGMISELSTKVDPIFNKFIDPPCIGKNGEFAECVFKPENEGLVATPEKPDGGNNPPCSLWVYHHYQVPDGLTLAAEHTMGTAIRDDFASFEQKAVGSKNWDRYNQWKEKFAQLWVRDPVTGEKRQVG